MTSYAYDSAGDVMQVTDPLGLVTRYSYDNLGRKLSQTQVSDTLPGRPDHQLQPTTARDRLVTETDPPVTDRVTGAVHTEGHHLHLRPRRQRADHHGQRHHRRRSVPDHHRHLQLPRPAGDSADALTNATSYTYDALGDELTARDPAGR